MLVTNVATDICAIETKIKSVEEFTRNEACKYLVFL